MLHVATDITLSPQKIKSILCDAEKSAEAINLVYVQDKQPGIYRIRRGEGFHYYQDKKRIRDELILERIKKLVIPPAWEDVWICRLENGHLQATGIDSRKRKQYKYHTRWNALRNDTKFYRLYAFGKAITAIRQQVEKDLLRPGLPVEKVLAAVVCLMEQTSIRVGNSMYEKLYGSFGLTTLKDKHVKISGGKIYFSFTGKKGIFHKISINSKRLAKIVKSCRDIPGKELFQYYDQEGSRRSIDSGMVNGYLKAITGQDFTAKDFRTWAGSVHAITAFKEIGAVEATTKADIKKNIVAVLDQVAEHLGNTRGVCKKYYVHPAIFHLYENNTLHAYCKKLHRFEKIIKAGELSCDERILMAILEKKNIVSI